MFLADGVAVVESLAVLAVILAIGGEGVDHLGLVGDVELL